jgi:hypothetical protein
LTLAEMLLPAGIDDAGGVVIEARRVVGDCRVGAAHPGCAVPDEKVGVVEFVPARCPRRQNHACNEYDAGKFSDHVPPVVICYFLSTIDISARSLRIAKCKIKMSK